MYQIARYSPALLACFFVINAVMIFYAGPYAWDDGAITLAYGKTLADHGIFALTKESDIVEGSSSLLLVGLSALVTMLARPDFYQLILWSQINALLFAGATIFLLYSYLIKIYPDKSFILLICSITAFMPMVTAEMLNGMEMLPFAAFMLLLVMGYEKKSRLAYFAIPLLLITRFEAIYYLAASFALLFWFDKENRRYIAKLLGYSAAVFAGMTLFRYLYFGDLLPNTIYAKMHAPYTPDELTRKITHKLAGAKEFVFVYAALIAALIFLFFKDERKIAWFADIRVALVISFASFALITGTNWGYAGRMTLACLPLMVAILISRLAARAQRALHSDSINVSSSTGRQKIAIWSVAALVLTAAGNASLAKQNIITAAQGGYLRDLYLPGFMAERLERKLGDSQFYGVTPENYRITGLAAEALRRQLGLPSIKFMVPDVGGLGLCCENINVLDSAMLTNKYLAKNGYASFDRYLATTTPDLIETHQTWSRLTGIYRSAYFRKNYQPIILNRNLFWIHSQHLPALVAGRGVITHADAATIPANTRYYWPDSIDQKYLRETYDGPIYEIHIS